MSSLEAKDQNKQRLLSLIGKGEAFRDGGSPPIHVSPPRTPPPSKEAVRDTVRRPQENEVSDEPPPERPEILGITSPEMGGMQLRERRRGMRSDPAWQQKTIYLKRLNIDRAEEIARLMGIDFSVLVDYALSLQVQDETRTPELQKWLDQRRNSDGF